VSSRRITLEVAVTTADEAVRACRAGADRLELCSALEVGGVTPSSGTFLQIVAAVPGVPAYVLLRPRTGGFVCSDREFATLTRDAEWFLANGAAGVVCGLLTAAGQIDQARCAELVKLANGKAVFHRAFDFLPDPLAALDELIALGFERVLTSGGAASAADGASRIAELVRRASGRIAVLPAGGIGPDNVTELLRATGCDQVHGSFRSATADPTLAANPHVGGQMGGGLTTDEQLIRRTRERLDRVDGVCRRT
jgi:copper homeostasis protein